MESSALSGLCSLIRQGREEQAVSRGAEVLAGIKRLTAEDLKKEVNEEIASKPHIVLREFGPADALAIIQYEAGLSKFSLLGAKGGKLKERQALERRPAEKQWQGATNIIIERDINSTVNSMDEDGFRYHSKLHAPGQTINCFLCGHPIIDPSQWSGGPKTPNGLALQCEHLFPSAATYLFFGDPSYGGIPEALKVNYRWAHATCNNKKSNKLFITMLIAIYDEGGRPFAFGVSPRPVILNKEVVDNFLRDLWSSETPQREQLKQVFDMVGTYTWEKFYQIAFASITANFAPLIEICNGRKQKFEANLFDKIIYIVNTYDPELKRGGKRKRSRKFKVKGKRTRRNKKSTKLVSR